MQRSRTTNLKKSSISEVTAKFFSERASALMKDLNLDCQLFVEQDNKRREKLNAALASNEGK